jgi:hypothetical protein
LPGRRTFLADRRRHDVRDTGVIHHRTVDVVLVAIDVHSTFGRQRHHFFAGVFSVIVSIGDGESGENSHTDHFIW